MQTWSSYDSLSFASFHLTISSSQNHADMVLAVKSEPTAYATPLKRSSMGDRVIMNIMGKNISGTGGDSTTTGKSQPEDTLLDGRVFKSQK
jgi:hypothetical protein